MDETVLRALIQKKQPIDPSVENSSQRDILLSIVKAITPKTVSSNSGSFSIDYCALQVQLQLLTEREIVPYQIRAADSAKFPMSNIYGHQMAIVNDLRTEEFKQYWKQLSLAKKQTITTVSEKELNMQIKESVYWFSLRYAMENYTKLFTDSRRIEIVRNESGFYLPPEMITEEKMSEMIDFAAMYDRCVMPGSASKPSQLFNELESEALYSYQKKPEEIGIHYCIHRFKMFLYWLLCNHMDEAFQMHKKEEEADREAALLLKEPVDKEKKKTKKKKRTKKATATATAATAATAATTATTATTATAATAATAATTATTATAATQTQTQTQTGAVEKAKEEKSSTSGKNPSNEKNQKEEKIAKSDSIASSSKTSLSPQSSSLQKNLEPDPATLPVPPPPPPSLEAQRITRLMLGDGGEGATNDRKRRKPDVSRPAFISLRQLLLRKDPLEEILRNSVAKRSPNVLKTN
ncbi:uncharacterized protein [Blastocystis hominis]|uniref:Uncharacterized protein n=1 Tax=Blastocystis hominis TaxID=12968 RepID=D8M5U0_BLAHO|nr:uncharacterized protein [Blastocystis hominis]CBK23539.2 unnamed protein product [Blastocystis hominis]|eukprot:XP_012897587.1 uncharacterized protein [Blastocystis hominis]